MRDKEFRDTHRSFDSIVGVEDQRAVNAGSIAQATGIPRETVRRKLKVLLAWGIQQTVQFMNDCLEQG